MKRAISQKRSCTSCPALASDTCLLGYKTEKVQHKHVKILFNVIPKEPCPKPKTKSKFKEYKRLLKPRLI